MKPKVDLRKTEGNWQTEMGGSIPGERVVIRGKDLFSELSDYSWMQLLLFMITGREFSKKESEFLDRLWALCISYPDPRVWNNRVAALAGTVRSTPALGISAGSAVSEAKFYGGQATLGAFEFLRECKSKLDSGEDLEQIIREELKVNRAIYGFGRPVTSKDERISPVQDLIHANGYEKGEYILLAYDIESILKTSRLRFNLNIAGSGCSSGAADMKFTSYEYYLWLVTAYNRRISLRVMRMHTAKILVPCFLCVVQELIIVVKKNEHGSN